MPVPQNRQLFGAQWNHSSSLAYRAEEKSSLLSSFWKEWLPRGKALHCHKRIVKPRAIYSSHNCLSASVFFFFQKIIDYAQHANPVTCFCLESPPPPSKEAGLRKGTHSKSPIKSGHPGIQPHLAAGQAPGHPVCSSHLCLCSPASPDRGRH